MLMPDFPLGTHFEILDKTTIVFKVNQETLKK